MVFYENQSSFFDVFYGATSDSGLDETSGVQASSTGPATTFSCDTATLTNGLKVTYNCTGGGGRRTPTHTDHDGYTQLHAWLVCGCAPPDCRGPLGWRLFPGQWKVLCDGRTPSDMAGSDFTASI